MKLTYYYMTDVANHEYGAGLYSMMDGVVLPAFTETQA